jgi:hypothetical protein
MSHIIRGESAMDSFAIRPTTWPVLKVVSRNPLMRVSDRIEAATIPLALLLVVVAAACAGVLGTFVHDAEKRKYSEESETRHAVIATALADSTPRALPSSADSNVVARWRTNGVEHIESIAWDHRVKAAAALPIWVNTEGNRVDAPTPVARAAENAVVIAFVAWWVAVSTIAQIVGVVRAHIARSLDAQWERDIRDLVDGENGRTNYP